MSVTVTANKTVSFRSPYTGQTFQQLSEKIFGRDGYIGGGATSDNGSIITVEKFTVVQAGIVADSLQNVTTLPVPTGAEPWFVIASLPDDDPDTGIVVSATTDLTTAANGVIVAFKTNGSWENPRPIDVLGASQNAAEVGVESGFAITKGTSAGLLNQLDVATGRVVDPDATRRDVPPASGQSAKVASVIPPTPHEAYVRNDLLVLRQRESFSPELTVLRGPTLVSASYTPRLTVSASGTATRPSFYGRPGGTINQQWWAWGDGNDLHILGGPSGGAFTDTILLSSGAITGCWIAGQRPSDDAVILVYLDGIALKVVSFNPSTGVQIDAPVTIDTQTNALTRPRGVLDGAGRLHVVYEHDEGTEQQVYYTKVETTAGVSTFGTPAVAPRIVAGGATGKNDTWPSVGVDRLGTAHIAYITGVAPNEYGDLVYAKIDSAGTLVDGAVSTYLVGSDAALDDGTGFVNEVYTSFRNASIAVTPHDEVYVAMLGSPTGGIGVDDTLLFSPSFRDRLGWDIIRLDNQTTGDYLACSLTANDHGGLHLFRLADAGGGTRVGGIFTIDTLPAPEGHIVGTVMVDNIVIPAEAMTTTDFDMPIALGAGGDVVVSLHTGTAGYAERHEALPGAAGPTVGPSAYTTHPNDVVLKTFRVDSSAAGTIPVSDGPLGSVFEVFNTRPKRMNYPFLVGDNGDYQGYESLERAVDAALHVGGEVVLRSGRHIVRNTVLIRGGITLRGEPMAYIDSASNPNATGLVISVSTVSGATPTITDNTISYTGYGYIRAGDFIELTGVGGTGLHRVAQVVDPNPASTVIIVDDAYGATTGTSPAGTLLAHIPAGLKFHNLCIHAGTSAAAAAYVLNVTNSYKAELKSLVFAGSHTDITSNPGAPITLIGRNIMPTIEHVDFTQFNAPEGHFAIDLGGPSGSVESPVVSHIRMLDGGPRIMVRAGCTNPFLSHIHGDGIDPTAVLVEVETAGGRLTPIYVVNVEGHVHGADSDLVVRTEVGRRLRVPEIYEISDDSPMELEDGNTRSSTIVDDAIKLTSPTQKEFNGATKDVITAAVNERVQAAGDTMTGNLVMAADILTDGVANRTLGANVANQRFAVNAAAITTTGIISSGAILTDGATQSLGAAGVGNGFNVNAESLEVASTARFNLDIDSDLIPASPYTLGAKGQEWHLQVDNVGHTQRQIFIPPAAFLADVATRENDYASAAASLSGYWVSSTSHILNLDIPISSFLRYGDRIVALSVLTDHVNIGGVQVTARFGRITKPVFGFPFTSWTQLGGDKTYTPSSSGAASTGWTTSDIDFSPNGYTLTQASYVMAVQIPTTTLQGDIKVGAVTITYDRP